jgi:hypothetical protein
VHGSPPAGADDCHTGVRSASLCRLQGTRMSVLKEFTHPLIVVCDGIAVDMVKLEAWKTQFNLP